jgi:hypothetical protein
MVRGPGRLLGGAPDQSANTAIATALQRALKEIRPRRRPDLDVLEDRRHGLRAATRWRFRCGQKPVCASRYVSGVSWGSEREFGNLRQVISGVLCIIHYGSPSSPDFAGRAICTARLAMIKPCQPP